MAEEALKREFADFRHGPLSRAARLAAVHASLTNDNNPRMPRTARLDRRGMAFRVARLRTQEERVLSYTAAKLPQAPTWAVGLASEPLGIL